MYSARHSRLRFNSILQGLEILGNPYVSLSIQFLVYPRIFRRERAIQRTRDNHYELNIRRANSNAIRITK